jgi:conjugative relaxase-like TrwC/TraI family protein
MLSTKVVGNPGQAQHYFLRHDNYYSEGNTLAQERSAWWGKAAKSLGLAGTVEAGDFTRLLRGQLPDGQQLGKIVDGQLRHRAGFDLTFSAPKSVSMLALMGKDERILTAVEKATDKALAMIERGHAQARLTRGGITQFEKTGKLVVARFLHDLSREGDPQLHTHCVVMNITQRADGKWRSLASEMGDYRVQNQSISRGFLESVRQHKKYYGAVFRAELAFEMQKLGYTVEKTGTQGFFEIAGIAPEAIKVFSQRRGEIESFLKEQGFQGGKAAAFATLQTRKAKQTIERQTLDALWRAKADLHGVNAFEQVHATVAQAYKMYGGLSTGAVQPLFTNEEEAAALIAVKDAIAHLSQTQVALRENELMHHAVQHIIGEQTSVSAVLQAVQQLQQAGSLIPLPAAPEHKGQRFFTTPQLLQYETALLQAAEKAHVSNRAIVPIKTLNAFLAASHDLMAEQRQALKILFSSHGQIGLLDGSSGSGKTHLLEPMMALAKIGGYQPILLTPAKHDSLDLKQQIQGVPSNLREWFTQLFDNRQFETVSRFLYLHHHESSLDKFLRRKPLILVDNATQLSSKQFAEINHHVERLGGRVVAVGDSNSTLTWQVGSPFTQLVNHAVDGTLARLSGNQRTRIAPLTAALAASRQGHIQQAFERIGYRIIAIADTTERLDHLAAHYANLPKAQRDHTRVLMPNKTSCEATNQAIRRQLQQAGEIATVYEQTMTVLLPHGMSDVELRYAKNYHLGQVVRFFHDYYSLGVRRGGYACVTGSDSRHNTVLLQTPNGKIHRWNPNKVAVGKMAVFDEKTRLVSVGERLIWRANDKQLSLTHGDHFNVTAISAQKITLTHVKNDRSLTLDLSQLNTRHFDYAYAVTPYQKNNQAPHIVIAYQNSVSRQSHQRAFYEIIGQATHQAWIYTDDKTRLLQTLQQRTGDKITAIDAMLYASTPHSPREDTPTSRKADDYVLLLQHAVHQALEKLQQAATPEGIAHEAVRYALAHLTEQEAAFDHKAVMETALKYVLGEAGIEHLQTAVIEAEKRSDLIRGIYSKDGTRWTTADAVAIEKAIITLAQRDQNTLPALAPTAAIEAYLSHVHPSEEHSQVLCGLFTQQDRVCLIQGYAGTGKTTLLQHVNALLKKQGSQMLCLAPTHTAVKEIRGRGLAGKTLDQFLAEYSIGKVSNLKHALIVVDEASMVSSRRMHDFLQAVNALNARALLMGDRLQYPAIEAGKPFISLQDAGVRTFRLQHITRQKEQILQQAVAAVYQQDYAKALQKLAKHIIEIGSYDVDGQRVDNRLERLEAIRDDYLARDPSRRAKTVVVTFGNEDRILQNALIREGLKERGELIGNAHIASILTPRHISEIGCSYVKNYHLSDIIRFNLSDRNLGIEKGQYWQVKAIYLEQNALLLTREGSAPMLWKPPQHDGNGPARIGVEVYHHESREILSGDLIRWTRSDKELGLLSPELVQVMHVDNQAHTFTVRSVKFTGAGVVHDGEPRVLCLTEARFQHWDHAYAITGYSTQGKTIQEEIVNAESFHPQLTSQPAMLVVITRAVHRLTLYTDNKEALLAAILRNKGEKRSALETLGQSPYQQVNSAASFIPSRVHPCNRKESVIPTKNNVVLDARRVQEMLKDNAEAVVEKLLGQPKKQQAGQYRYGGKSGSLIVTLGGNKRGLWHDFQTGEGGTLLHLVAKQYDLDIERDFKTVLQESLRVLGTSEVDLQIKTPGKRKEQASQLMPAVSKEQLRSLRYAQKLARDSKPVENTLGARYLQQHRHIVLDKYPDNIRFHPGIYSKKNGGIYPALLVVGKDDNNQVQAVQAIFLDEKTANKANVIVKKQTWGSSAKVAVQLGKPAMRGAASPTYLAEGAETALSIYAALQPQKVSPDVRITLGKSNFKNIDSQQTAGKIVLCLDNDGKNPNSETLIHSAALKLIEHGKQVWIAQPQKEGDDYNDVLKTQGLAAVKNDLQKAIAYDVYQQKTQGLSSTEEIALLDAKHVATLSNESLRAHTGCPS